MLLGYNTNGLANCDPAGAIELLAAIGYQSVAITIDQGMLNPYEPGFRAQLIATRQVLDHYAMRSVVETGARFLLDPEIKHEPTLVSADPGSRARRIEFLKHATDVAAELGSDCVSLWSGKVRDDALDRTAWSRLTAGLEQVLAYAASRQVKIGFEAEPDMFVDTMARYAELIERIGAEHLLLTLDVGHLHCQGEAPIADQIERWGSRIANVHIEDMRRGVHEHLMFGEGEMDFPPILAALEQCRYGGGVHVELSRHSQEGPAAARRAYEFLRPLFNTPSRHGS